MNLQWMKKGSIDVISRTNIFRSFFELLGENFCEILICYLMKILELEE